MRSKTEALQGRFTVHQVGEGDRIQLTYETARFRVQNPDSPVKYGMNQSNPGVKWRFYDTGENGLSISIFPQFFLNNPDSAVNRQIVSPNNSFLMPVEVSKKVGPVDMDFETGYQWVRKGPDGWVTGLVVGNHFTSKLEGDIEVYNVGTFHPSYNQITLDIGGRYKLHSPVILPLMAGRALQPAGPKQAYFVGYFGIQLLLPPRSYAKDAPEASKD